MILQILIQFKNSKNQLLTRFYNNITDQRSYLNNYLIQESKTERLRKDFQNKSYLGSILNEYL